MDNKYELTGRQIRDIAEGYAYLAILDRDLKNESRPGEKEKIARKILREALPHYRGSIPQDLDYVPRSQVDPGALEETCMKIL